MKRAWILVSLLALSAGLRAKDLRFSLFDFEDAKAAAAWSWTGPLVTALEASKGKALDGVGSMAIKVSAAAGATSQAYIKVTTGLEALGPGSVVEFKLYIPAGSAFSGFEPYSSDANGHWSGAWTGDFHAGEWNTFLHRVPCDAAKPLAELGLYLFASDAMQTAAYLDAVTGSAPSTGNKALKKPVLRALKVLP